MHITASTEVLKVLPHFVHIVVSSRLHATKEEDFTFSLLEVDAVWVAFVAMLLEEIWLLVLERIDILVFFHLRLERLMNDVCIQRVTYIYFIFPPNFTYLKSS